MKNQQFKYQIKDNRLWSNNTEITNKQTNNPHDWLFILQEEKPRHWIRLKLRKDQQWLKVFAKRPNKQGVLHYFEQWHQIADLDQPLSFQLTPTDEVVKQANGRWGKIDTKKYE